MKGGKKMYITNREKNLTGGNGETSFNNNGTFTRSIVIRNQYKYIKKCNIDNIDIQVGDLFRINQTSHYRGIYKYHNYIEIFNHRKQCIYTIGIITDTSKFNTRTKK